MNFNFENLRKDEQLPLIFGQLYGQFGYKKFRMEKFEEYDFYAKNKSFLKSHKIITFPNSEGKLAALKPDITLSIIKNTKATDETPEKRYYNESVYRISKYTGDFKEIAQTGLEYMGKITLYTIAEILGLALKSLKAIEENYVLSIASVDFLTAVISDCTDDQNVFSDILKAFSEKNEACLDMLFEKEKITEENTLRLKSLMTMYGKLSDCLDSLKELVFSETTKKAYEHFCEIADVFDGTEYAEHIRIDFSIVEDITYYNGLVFQGYVSSVPHSVLSGGRYDRLLKLMNKDDISGIGFAVYLGDFERYLKKNRKISFDTMILYDENSDIKTLNSVIDEHTKNGKTFFAEKFIPEKYGFSKIIKINGKNICEVNPND